MKTSVSNAQTDTLVFKNKDMMVGEIKSLNEGILTIETDYSKKDFTIEWSGIREIYTRSSFLIILENGTRLNGSLLSVQGTDTVRIYDETGSLITQQRIAEIVFLKGLKSSFWSRTDANIDIGITLTKANNLRQFNMSSLIGYLADKWQTSVTYSDNRSKQDSVNQTKRSEANIDFKYFLQHDWFLNTSLNFLSNTEQALKLRTTGKVGAGKYLLHTNKEYWGVGGGLSINNESYTNNASAKNSLEIYAATELNLFDLKNLDLLGNLFLYRSITESGRWRSDFKLNLKYDLPFDFYIKPGVSINYDNRPAIAGNETDYVFTFSIGWELKD